MTSTGKSGIEKSREIVASVRDLEIRTNKLVDELWAGQYRSVFRGRGMDFDEVREYAPGDEVRTIDWKVTARMGAPFVKKFTEERELTVMLLVDVSASGKFGSVRAKREMMAEVAGALALSALRCGDKVGLILFSDEVELYLPPAKGRSHALRMLRDVMFFEPESEGTDLRPALEFLNGVTSRRTIAMLLSDFCVNGDNDALNAIRPLLTVTGRQHDFIACAVNDPWELELPNVGTVTIEDSETGEQLVLNTSRRSVREAYKAEAGRRRAGLRRVLRAAGSEMLELRTTQPYLPELARFFEARKRRIAS